MDAVLEKFLRGLKDLGLRNRIERIYLFGSRAKGRERPSSDYDLLIVSPHPDKGLKSKLYDIVVDLLLETQRVVSLKIFPSAEFRRLRRMQTPFMQNVLKEGVRIG
ncbi:MAG: nucleotidyltransferase domain-containing protein [Candidatus Omnitrophota bacterium]